MIKVCKRTQVKSLFTILFLHSIFTVTLTKYFSVGLFFLLFLLSAQNQIIQKLCIIKV